MHKIWAVAKNTIAQAMRMKIALVFVLFLIVVLPIMSLITTGDGTLKGKLQTFTSYSLGLTTFMLSILTIIVSGYSLSSDLKQNLLYTVITKPLKRYQLFLGKFLGVVILNAALLIGFATIIYCITIYMPQFTKASSPEIEIADKEFFTARAEIDPMPLDIAAVAEKAYNDIKAQGRLPQDMNPSEFRMRLAKQIEAQSRAVVPGTRRIWQFESVVPQDPKGSLFLKYKFEVSQNPPGDTITGIWAIGDYRPAKLGNAVNLFEYARSDKTKTFHEIELPASYAALDGHIDVIFENYYYNNTIVIFPEDGLKLLYQSDTFLSNYIRACLVIFCRLIFFAALGVSLSAWLGFPVVILISLAVFFIGLMSGFIIDSFSYLEGASGIFGYIGSVVYLLPRFDGTYSPIEFIISARLLTWSFLGEIFFKLVCVKALIVLLAGILIFNKREIAKITV